ncbi:MAG: TOBE domain-containing protein, partial [Halobacteriota archaeon]
ADEGASGGDVSTAADEGASDGPTRTAAVDVGGETLRVRIDETSDVEVGDRLTFCVRPEYLRIDEGESRLAATVASAEFLGETTRVTLDWGGRDLLVRTRDPLSGEVVVGFDPEDAHVIDDRARVTDDDL